MPCTVFFAFYYIFSFYSHKNPGLGNKRTYSKGQNQDSLSSILTLEQSVLTIILYCFLNCSWNMVFHFLHFHFFNYEGFLPLCLYVLFLFFPLKIAFHVFCHLLLGYWSFILTETLLRKSALCQLCYKHFPGGFHLIFVCGIFFFCHRHLNIYVVKYVTLSFCASRSYALKAFCKFQYLSLVSFYI